jgi:hypothetical protein
MVHLDMPVKPDMRECRACEKARRNRGGRARFARAFPLCAAFAAGAVSLYLIAPSPRVSQGVMGAAHVLGDRVRSAVPPRFVARRANFHGKPASVEARRIADWVVDSKDNQGLPFVVVDKVKAEVFAFDASGSLTGAAPALLGITIGDDSTPGVGEKTLSEIHTGEKTTAAGRFVAELGHDLRGEDVVWVDYDSGLSLHRVLRTNPSERREERLDTPTVADNRISFGCINVPVTFYEHVIRPAFLHSKGIVYVLPEVKSAREVFAAYDAYESARTRAATVRGAGRRSGGSAG